MKRANSKLAALTLITTLGAATFASTTAHANDNIWTGDQAVARNHKPITNEQLQKTIGNQNHITIQARFGEDKIESHGIKILGPVKTQQPKTPDWNLWTRFTTFVKGIFS
ncbi:TPA: hypothetical protein U1186_000609 [Streptococcus suis]|nr:hypothetical protein [Streptococcus suis]